MKRTRKAEEIVFVFLCIVMKYQQFSQKNVFLGHPVTILQEFFFNWYKLKLIQFTRYIN